MKVVTRYFRRQRIFIVMMVVMPMVSGIFMGCPLGGTGGTNVPGTSADASGVIMVPTNPAPYALQVDGLPMSMNADLSTGDWEWYKFGGEAGKKYYIYATGNAPVNLILFQGILNEEEEEEMAVMLWTTDPAEPEFFYWEHEAVNGVEEVTKAATTKAIAIPSFVAPADGNYYVVVQAAKVLECLPDCKEEDVRLAVYYDVRTYSIQVSTYAETADANALTIYKSEEAAEAPFVKGEVKMNKHDWFYFDATADTNYMIEFMEPADNRGSVTALVYSPLGDITCEVIDCDNCVPQPIYSPQAGRYYILVALDEAAEESGYLDLTPDAEFFGCEYLLRVFVDDCGNLPAVALPQDTPPLNGEVVMDGYLTRGDEDWREFVAEPYSSYWVETRGDFDLRLNVSGNTEAEPLNEDDPGIAAYLMRNYDGRNDMAVFQTGRREEEIPFSVRMMYKPLNPFKIDIGAYSVAILGDDHVNAHLANVVNATEIAVGSNASGILWQADTDLFKFSAPQEHFLYEVTMEGANFVEVSTINDEDTGFEPHGENALDPDARQTKPLPVYYDNNNSGKRVFVAVDGVDEDVLQTPYTVSVVEDDHRNQTDDFEDDIAVAQAITPGTPATGILWPTDTDVFKVNAPAGKMVEVVLAAEKGSGTMDLGWWDPDTGFNSPVDHTSWHLAGEAGDYGIVVTHNANRDNLTVDYTLSVRFDDHHNGVGDFADVINAETPPATKLELPGESQANELWPGDTDVFWVDITEEQAGRQLEVVVGTEEEDNVFNVSWWSEANGQVGKEDTFYIPVNAERYGIVVQRTNVMPDEIVNYDISVRLNDKPNRTANFINNLGIASEISSGDEETNDLWPGATDMYKVLVAEADYGKQLTVTLQSADDPAIALKLWPDGLGEQTDGEWEEGMLKLTTNLAEGVEAYLITVDGSGLDEIVNYTMNVKVEEPAP